jgi:hypothetical protein
VGGCGMYLSGSDQEPAEGKKISVSIKCGETDKVSKHQPFRKVKHTHKTGIQCADL